MKIGLIGAGQRGSIYAGYLHDKKGAEIGAVVDISKEKLKRAGERFGTPDDMLFSDFESFAEKKPGLSGVIISTMDRDHYQQAMKCLELGYDILLEKPISPDIEECAQILKKARETKRKVLVCHVLRYTNFFAKIKQILDSGESGKIVTIQHAENIGSFHMAHSFVRGNWRNSDASSPIIMQKSCHDMDILVWLSGSRAKEISSFGNLTYFKRENAPEGSADRCLQCPVAGDCRFDVKKAYLPVRGGWPAEVICEDQSEEGLLEALKESPYGRCVYKCDNNVCDNQVTNILFENGVTVSFHLSGLTNKMHRTIKIMCEKGEIIGDDYDNTIVVTHYSPNAHYEGESRIINVKSKEGFHGGGDYGLSVDFYNMLAGEGCESLSSIDKSVESHLMAYAAERSRTLGQTVYMEDVRREFDLD
jgi:predicted dehydrogenase